MKAKKYILFLLLIMALVVTSACSGQEKKNGEIKNTTSKSEIKIDVTSDEKYIISAIWAFNKNYNDIKINYDTVTYDEDYKNKYIAKLLVGEGPDIIKIEPWLFSAVHKVAGSGILYDMNNLISKDKSFKLSDYNQKVMDGGIINGKRLFLPLIYDFHVFYAKNSALKENGIVPEGSGWTLEYLAKKASEFTQKNNNNGRTFMLSSNFSLSYILKISGLDFINYEKKEAKFNSAEFIDLLNIYKKMCQTIKKSSLKLGSFSIDNTEALKWDIDTSEIDNGSSVLMDNTNLPGWFKSPLNKRLNAYLFPQYTDKRSILVEPKLSFAINAKSTHKKEVYEFIKLLLSEEYQSSKKERYLINIPVNNNAYIDSVDFFLSNLDGAARTANDEADIEKKKLLLKKQLDEIERISRCDTIDQQIYDIVDAEAKSFINGRNTADQTSQIIQDKVMLYLNE